MKSKVSFKFDGDHNVTPIVTILKNDLPNFKYKLEKIGFVYRIYIYSSLPKEEVLKICQKIQCFAIYDETAKI